VKGHTHLLIGGAVGIPLAVIIPASAIPSSLPAFAISCALSGVAALLPDIDHERSTISTFLRRNLGGSKHSRGRHRGGTHSFFGTAIAGLLAGLAFHQLDPPLALPAAVIVALGYLSHLVADVISPYPMRWLWPFRRHPIRPRWIPAIPHSGFEGQLVELATIGVVLAIFVLAGAHWFA